MNRIHFILLYTTRDIYKKKLFIIKYFIKYKSEITYFIGFPHHSESQLPMKLLIAVIFSSPQEHIVALQLLTTQRIIRLAQVLHIMQKHYFGGV